MSTALGLSSEFCGEDRMGGAFSVEVRIVVVIVGGVGVGVDGL